MHIDHEKLVELLAEASGIEKEKVEKQIEELVAEIREAIEEGEAYEVDNFGIFSGMGENLVFIPNKDLETEINYKYVGMEPIEMEGQPESSASAESAPAPPADEEEYEDPFGIIGEEPEEESKETKPVEEIADAEASEEEAMEGAEEELEADTQEKAGADEWGIDSYKDDESSNVFSGMLGETVDEMMEEEDLVSKSGNEDAEQADDADTEAEVDMLTSEGDEEEVQPDMEKAAIKEEADDSDADEDPFGGLEDVDEEEEAPADQHEDEVTEKEDADDVVPVITNLSSQPDKKKKKPEPEAVKKDTKPQKTRHTPAKEKEASPMLLVLVIILLLGGGAAALGYFGIVNIPGITPEMTASNQSTPPSEAETQAPAQNTPEPEASNPVLVQEEDEPANTDAANEASADEAGNATDEEGSIEEDASPSDNTPANAMDGAETEMTETAPPGQSEYGLTGQPVASANDGFTIVLFSLSNEDNAREKIRELNEIGYRGILDARSSAQYGTIWRVSIGQFESITDAAIAAERIEEPYASNYFITKIQ